MRILQITLFAVSYYYYYLYKNGLYKNVYNLLVVSGMEPHLSIKSYIGLSYEIKCLRHKM